MTGAGNDFIIADAEAWASASEGGGDAAAPAWFVSRLCDRRYGIGADGLMVISGPPRLSVTFYNADGSGGMLCGNGARCALVYAARRGWAAYGEAISFEFAGRPYRGVALGPDRSRFELDPRYSTRLEDGVEADGVIASGRFVDLGSPHFIVDLDDLKIDGYPAAALATLELDRVGPILRRHPRFAPDGVNLSVCALEGGLVHIRTYERGVEAETLACGTGSAAAALSYALKGLARPPVAARTRSGETLVIDFDDARKPRRLSLEGPARAVFEGDTEGP